MLWSGYYLAELSKLPLPILEEMPKISVKAEGKVDSMYTANCSADVEDVPAGGSLFWFFPHDEIHHVLKGAADVTYSLAGTSHTEKKAAHLAEGDWYIVPAGARVTWNVSAKGPMRLLWIALPGVPRSPYKRTQSVKLGG